jgi:hypothetical protein
MVFETRFDLNQTHIPGKMIGDAIPASEPVISMAVIAKAWTMIASFRF